MTCPLKKSRHEGGKMNIERIEGFEERKTKVFALPFS